MIRPEFRRPPSQAMPIRSRNGAENHAIIHSKSESEVIRLPMAGVEPFILRRTLFQTSNSLTALSKSVRVVHSILPQ